MALRDRLLPTGATVGNHWHTVAAPRAWPRITQIVELASPLTSTWRQVQSYRIPLVLIPRQAACSSLSVEGVIWSVEMGRRARALCTNSRREGEREGHCLRRHRSRRLCRTTARVVRTTLPLHCQLRSIDRLQTWVRYTLVVAHLVASLAMEGEPAMNEE